MWATSNPKLIKELEELKEQVKIDLEILKNAPLVKPKPSPRDRIKVNQIIVTAEKMMKAFKRAAKNAKNRVVYIDSKSSNKKFKTKE